jgi:hypothetical protein
MTIRQFSPMAVKVMLIDFRSGPLAGSTGQQMLWVFPSPELGQTFSFLCCREATGARHLDGSRSLPGAVSTDEDLARKLASTIFLQTGCRLEARDSQQAAVSYFCPLTEHRAAAGALCLHPRLDVLVLG